MTDTQSRTSDFLDNLLAELRPRLHRYCARMTGSVIDGEDVVQEAMLKAMEALRGEALQTTTDAESAITHPQAWLFRIAHNAAVDFLRRRARQGVQLDEEVLAMIPDPVDEMAQRQAAAASLRTFMHLPTPERSSVILMDVLGYSLREVAEVMQATIPAVKAALHRGRDRLRHLALRPDELPPPAMTIEERGLLAAYIDRFNAHDFDAVRRMIADDVRLDLIGRKRMRGRAEVEQYFGNYTRLQDWHLSLGFIDRHPAILVSRAGEPSDRPVYAMLLRFENKRVADIRDYRYAAYVTQEAEIVAVT
jgi:RNA polymerase sigma-70 factor (ECF subfamily)